MEIRDEPVGEVLVLSPDGDLSTAEDCHALEQRLSAAVAAGNRFVVVDCARVGHLTSPALRALLLASRKLARAKGRLVLCGMTPKVQKAFSISGFDRDFTVLPARDAALRAALEPPLVAPAKAVAPRPPAPAPPSPAAAPPSPAPAPPSPAAAPPLPAPPPAAASSPLPARRAAGAKPTSPAPAVTAALPDQPASPDPRLAVAARLLAALGEGAQAAENGGAPADASTARDALAAALMHAFDVHPA